MSLKILFLCTGNSCRSQMAEGWAKHYYGKYCDIYSAGIEKHGLNNYAVQAMWDLGIDISNHISKTVDDLEITKWDVVITVCDHADETCPRVLKDNCTHIHLPFADPPAITKGWKDQQKILDVYRHTAQQIEQEIISLKNRFKFFSDVTK